MRAVQPVVLCGGEGTRLWPLSRPERPKPLLPLGDGPSLLADTLARFDPPRYGPPLLVCAQVSAQAIARAHPGVEQLVERAPSGTAAAVLAAARHVASDDVLLVVPADHAVGETAPLHEAVDRALHFAATGEIVLFGLTPTRAEPGFGWIVSGESVGPGVHRVVRFEEKPAPSRAEELFRSGASWNSGMFCFRAGAVLDLAQRLDLPPDEELRGSFDRRVVERAPAVAVVPVTLDWSDLGTWEAVHAWRRGETARFALRPGEPVPSGALQILDGTVENGRAGPLGAIVARSLP